MYNKTLIDLGGTCYYIELFLLSIISAQYVPTRLIVGV